MFFSNMKSELHEFCMFLDCELYTFFIGDSRAEHSLHDLSQNLIPVERWPPQDKFPYSPHSSFFFYICILKLKPGVRLPCQTCLKEGHLTLPNVTACMYQFLWPILGQSRVTIFLFKWKKTLLAGGEQSAVYR